MRPSVVCAVTSNATGLVTPRRVSSPVAVAVICSSPTGIRPNSIGSVSHERRSRELCRVHDAAGELAVAPTVVARDVLDLHGDVDHGCGGALDREQPLDLVAASHGRGVHAGEHLFDAVAELGCRRRHPIAVEAVGGCGVRRRCRFHGRSLRSRCARGGVGRRRRRGGGERIRQVGLVERRRVSR